MNVAPPPDADGGVDTGDPARRADPTAAARAGIAVAALFFVNGATFANWLPRIPEIRDQLGIGNATLGAALLGGGLGGVIGALTVGRLADRFGSARLLTVAALALSLGMPLIAWVPTAALLLVLLVGLGVLDVYNDVAMNAQAVLVQERWHRPILNRMHAMWSLGFTGGALVGGVARALEVGVRAHLAVVGAALLATVLVSRRRLLADPVAGQAGSARPPTHAGDSPRRRRPNLAMVTVAMAAMAAISLEVTPNDWAAVFFTDVFDAGRAAGFGTVACAGGVLLGRLVGDHILERVGERRMLVGAMWLVAIGLVVTVTSPGPVIAIVGLVVWGLGLAPLFPVLYAVAARLPGTSAGAGLGWMLLGQRLGSMLTALTVGAVAQWADPRAAFAVMGGCALALLVLTLLRGTAHRR